MVFSVLDVNYAYKILLYLSRGRKGPAKTDATLPEVDVCKLDKKAGPCRSMRPRFFYNQDSAECEVIFAYIKVTGCLCVCM